MINNSLMNRVKMMVIFLYLCTSMFLVGCQEKAINTQTEEAIVIRQGHFVDENGILYDDARNFTYKSYYDFESKTNLYFCSKPNCDHSSIDCVARQSHPYSFIYRNNQYYIESKFEMDESDVKIVSYLFKSDISNTGTKVIARLDGETLNDIYLINNQLNILVAKPKFVDGIANSTSKAELYQINLNDYSIKKTLISTGEYDGYIVSGIIDNKMIIYHRYYEKIVDPVEYGMDSNSSVSEFIKDTENYKRYMDEVMKYFHEEMLSLDLRNGKLEQLELPTPLLIHKEYYYYNKKKPEGSYYLISHNFITKEETILYDDPVKKLSIVGDTLFIEEGIEKISDITFQSIIGKLDNPKEYTYHLITGEQKEVMNNLSEQIGMDLITEYEDYYIFFYSNREEGTYKRIGYIKKEDYYNGKDNYTLVNPI